MTEKDHKSPLLSHIQVTLDLQKKSFLVALLVFVFFALLSIIGQVYLPEILKLSGVEIGGLPKPSMTSVFENVWGNFILIGAILVIFQGSTTFSSDLNVDKPMYILMSRPISRDDYYLVISVLKLVGILVVVFITSLMTYLISDFFFDPIPMAVIIWGSLVQGLALASLLAIQISMNTRLSTGATAVWGIILLVSMTTLNILATYLKYLKWFSPLALSSISNEILFQHEYDHVLANSLVLLIWVIAPLLLGMYLFRKRDL